MTERPKKNPFRPGVGIRPPYLAGREAELRRFDSMLRAAPEQPANMRLTGLRGVGKTVLLHEFESRAKAHGWATAPLEFHASHNSENGLLSTIGKMRDDVKMALSRLERIRSTVGAAIRNVPVEVKYNDIALSLKKSESGATADLVEILMDLCSFVVSHACAGVLLLFDEAQIIRDDKTSSGPHALSTLVSAVLALQRKELSIGLVLCGLPTLTGNLLKARSYTERMFRGEQIGRLAQPDALKALVQPLSDAAIDIEDDVAEAIIDEVEGYPYFIQLWGAQLWDAAFEGGVSKITAPLLNATEVDIYHRLDRDFYEPRISTLTPAEQDLLLATAKAVTYPPVLVSELNEVTDKTPNNVNVLLGRMVEAGVLYRVRKGQYDYTAPKFRTYLQRRGKEIR